jgi:hypothetical protein
MGTATAWWRRRSIRAAVLAPILALGGVSLLALADPGLRTAWLAPWSPVSSAGRRAFEGDAVASPAPEIAPATTGALTSARLRGAGGDATTHGAATPATPRAAAASRPAPGAPPATLDRAGRSTLSSAGGGGRSGAAPRAHEVISVLFDLLLCREDGEPRCLIGGDGSFLIETGPVASLGEEGISRLVAQRGGYMALCLNGMITMFRAADEGEGEGPWAVDVVRLDPAGLIDPQLDGYNDGQTCWTGRPSPPAQARAAGRSISEQGLDEYNRGRRIYRGEPTFASDATE